MKRLLPFLLLPAWLHGADLAVDVSFPNASATKVAVDQQARTIQFSPIGWAWWRFKVTGITPGETIRLQTKGPANKDTADLKAVFSTDQGKTWRVTPAATQLGAQVVGANVDYAVPVEAAEAEFAYFVPYTTDMARAAVEESVKRIPGAKAETLGKSKEGKEVHAVRIKDAGVPDAERVGIWIQARQHAWELSGSWTARGLLGWLATDEAAPLRRRAEIVIVPVFDVDGVDAGLTMQPVNPNRLWVDDRPVIYNKAGNGGRGTLESYAEGPADAPLQPGFIRVEKPHEPFPQISQAMKLIRDLDARGRGLAVFLDLHNYAYRGTDAMQFWKVAQRADLSEAHRAMFSRFEQAMQSLDSTPLRVRMVTHETYAGLGKDSTTPVMADRWVMASCKAPVALTQESAMQQADLPLQNPPQAEHLRRGAILGRVISKYLEP